MSDGRRHPAAASVLDYGATGDGETLETATLQNAIDSCSQAGGGTLYFPPGRYLTGSLSLRSDMVLHLDAGAVLLGSQDPSGYPVIDTRWEGIEQPGHAPLLGGRNLCNVSIRGRGLVDGRGDRWWADFRAGRLEHARPRLICFERCSGVEIEGITAINSPAWTINPIDCDNVTVHGITIVNPADSPNTDGINPESCRNVHISDCHIDVGDDCITVKSGTERIPAERRIACENITVTNCTMIHGHGGVVIGSEMSGHVRNVVITNCVFKGTDRGIRLKSRRGRGGIVEDIRVSNIVMEDVLCPITMNLYYNPGARGDPLVADKEARPVTQGTPCFRRIHLSHISAHNAVYAAGFLYGLAEMPLEEISIDHFEVRMSPAAQGGYPEMADGLEPMQRAGIYVRNARNLRLHAVRVSGQAGPAVTIIDSSEVEVSASGTPTPDPSAAVLALNEVDGAFVHGCRAAPGTGLFLRVEGVGSYGVVLAGNDLSQAREAVQTGRTSGGPAVTVND